MLSVGKNGSISAFDHKDHEQVLVSGFTMPLEAEFLYRAVFGSMGILCFIDAASAIPRVFLEVFGPNPRLCLYRLSNTISQILACGTTKGRIVLLLMMGIYTFEISGLWKFAFDLHENIGKVGGSALKARLAELRPEDYGESEGEVRAFIEFYRRNAERLESVPSYATTPIADFLDIQKLRDWRLVFTAEVSESREAQTGIVQFPCPWGVPVDHAPKDQAWLLAFNGLLRMPAVDVKVWTDAVDVAAARVVAYDSSTNEDEDMQRYSRALHRPMLALVGRYLGIIGDRLAAPGPDHAALEALNDKLWAFGDYLRARIESAPAPAM
jgi:hypothetical protein